MNRLITQRLQESHLVHINDTALPVRIWEEPSLLGRPSQDASGWKFFESAAWQDGQAVLRIVVADGMTPYSGVTPSFGELDGAMFAAQTAVRNCMEPGSALDAALRTNHQLAHELQQQFPDLQLTRRQRPQTMLRVVDVIVHKDATWHLDILNAGDCSTRVFDGKIWIDPVSERGYTDAGDEQVARYRTENPNASIVDVLNMEDVVFATPDDFDSTPIGAFATESECKFTVVQYWPAPSTAAIGDLGLLVLSDGMREGPDFNYGQTAERLEYLSNPNTNTASLLYVKSRDDITVVAVGERSPNLTH